MKTRLFKAISLIIAAAVLFSTAPVTVLAEQDSLPAWESEDEPVLLIGEGKDEEGETGETWDVSVDSIEVSSDIIDVIDTSDAVQNTAQEADIRELGTVLLTCPCPLKKPYTI